jgi:uncharacterized protein (DUF1330 family)
MVMNDKPAAYLTGHIRIKDAAKWAEYCSKVPATLAPWDAKLMLRGQRSFTLHGSYPHTDIVVIRFADADAIRRWHDSAAYQALIPLRDQAAEVALVGFET